MLNSILASPFNTIRIDQIYYNFRKIEVDQSTKSGFV